MVAFWSRREVEGVGEFLGEGFLWFCEVDFVLFV